MTVNSVIGSLSPKRRHSMLFLSLKREIMERQGGTADVGGAAEAA